jgi:hypothetical protein
VPATVQGPANSPLVRMPQLPVDVLPHMANIP